MSDEAGCQGFAGLSRIGKQAMDRLFFIQPGAALSSKADFFWLQGITTRRG